MKVAASPQSINRAMPEGRRIEVRSLKSEIRPPCRHFERSEKSLLFAVRRVMFGKFETGNLLSADFRASPYLYSRRFIIFVRRTATPHS